jgi:hypothetical protein
LHEIGENGLVEASVAKVMKRFFAVLLVVISGCKPAPSPSAVLASPSQEVRDAAAKILRSTAKPPPKNKWRFFTWRIRKGESETDILALLSSYKINTQSVFGMRGGGNHTAVYQLDDYWELGCRYQEGDNSLMEWELSPGWRIVAVWPSNNFTGVWINYYANGQKYTEICYTNGLRDGDFWEYSANGSKDFTVKYDHGKERSSTVYYPSGRIHQQIQCRSNHFSDFVVDYNEDGSTNHILDQHYDNGVHQILMTKYFPSGHVQFVDQESNDVHFRISFNEDGSTNQISDH